MSCHWELYCRTCDRAITSLDWNHGGDQLADFLATGGLELVGALAKVTLRRGYDLKCGFEMGPEVNHDLIKTCAAHVGHDVTVRSEYGEFHDRCGVNFSCGHCAARYYCARKKGHAEPHMEFEPEDEKTYIRCEPCWGTGKLYNICSEAGKHPECGACGGRGRFPKPTHCEVCVMAGLLHDERCPMWKPAT